MQVLKSALGPIAATIFGLFIFFVGHFIHWDYFVWIVVGALLVAVVYAVHHAEVIAERVGQPFGALVLALAVTVIEVSIIISLMLTGNSDVAVLARDTVFGAVMIILTGISGLTLLIGGVKFHEQSFKAQGVLSVLTVLVAISVLTLILPNYTSAIPGPYYSKYQLIFVSIITLVLYGTFLFVQNFKHRAHFLSDEELSATTEKPSAGATVLSSILLPLNLIAVVLLAELMAPDLEKFIKAVGAPISLSGIIIACFILLP